MPAQGRVKVANIASLLDHCSSLVVCKLCSKAQEKGLSPDSNPPTRVGLVNPDSNPSCTVYTHQD